MNKAKQIFLLISLLGALAPGVGLAQNAAQARIDSLKRVIETADEDSTKARSLCQLCWELLLDGQSAAAREQGEAGLQLARKNNFKTETASCQMKLGAVYADLGETEQALKMLRDVLKSSVATDHPALAAATFDEIARINWMQNDLDTAIRNLQKGLEIRRDIGDLSGAADALNNLGLVYHELGNYQMALRFYLECQKTLARIGEKGTRILLYNNISSVYHALGDTERALEYAWQVERALRETGASFEMAMALGHLGDIYTETGRFGKGAELIERSLDYFAKSDQTLETKAQTAAALMNLGNAHRGMKNYDQQKDFFLKSKALYEKLEDGFGLASVNANLAQSLLETGEPAAARRLASEALVVARSVGAKSWIEFSAQILSKADSALGDWQSAYEHYKLFKQYADSLHNESQSKEIGRLEAQYEFDKEIEERERLEAEAAERRQMLYWVAAGVFAALLLVAGLLTWGYRTKRKANKQLASQNAEIIQQSEEISQQRDELQALNEQITGQRDVLEKAHEAITDSIDYASRIQQALLPASETMKKGAEVFVYYKARDVVSGDFYWTRQIDAETFLYAAVDCTGHGVPGAFMSVLGSTTLDTIVREYGETRPDLMLKLLDQGVRASLKQDENEAAHKDGSLDGMDLALVKLDRKRGVLAFSSAGRPLYLLRNGEIREYKGAKFPAGGAQHGEKTFPLETIPLETGDRFFLFSDGITDQFGGPRGRKFSPRRLKETLLAHQDKDLQAQGAAFAEAFDEWQKAAKQLDDQLLLALAP